MLRYLPAGAMASFLLLVQGNSTVNAQMSSAAMQESRATIVQTIRAQPETVEIVANGSIITVLRVNSNMNDAAHGGSACSAESYNDSRD